MDYACRPRFLPSGIRVGAHFSVPEDGRWYAKHRCHTVGICLGRGAGPKHSCTATITRVHE